jgi:zinc transport system permease protein
MPVWLLNMLVAIVAALTVTVAMRVVGLLLVSALMIVPVAVAQQVTHSFRRTMTAASIIGVVVCVIGLSITFWYNVSPGAVIVVIAIAVYVLASLIRPLLHRKFSDHDPHPDMRDDVALTAAEVAAGSAESAPVSATSAVVPSSSTDTASSASGTTSSTNAASSSAGTTANGWSI